jgi:16S rRNA (uracil1498-N3)-methyltransferase
MHRFLVPSWTDQTDGRIVLPDAERHHARVLRLRDGEDIEIFDGRGASCRARFEPARAGDACARVVERLPDGHREARVAISLAVAPLKRDRFDWLVEKATELGAVHITAFSAERAVARPSARRRERWDQIAAAAAKQCGRTIVPEVDEADDLAGVLARRHRHPILLHESGPRQPLHTALGQGAVEVLLLIGPEGGFTNAELQQARAASIPFASLGERILRAETAALAALACVGSRE